jgi:hypothetical protein
MGSTLTLRLPKSLHGRIKDLAKSAAAEKMSALLTQNYLEEEAAKGQQKDFEKVLKAVPHIEPEPFDQL